MLQAERLELALQCAGFWPGEPEVAELLEEERRETIQEVCQALEGARLVVLAWVAMTLFVSRHREVG